MESARRPAWQRSATVTLVPLTLPSAGPGAPGTGFEIAAFPSFISCLRFSGIKVPNETVRFKDEQQNFRAILSYLFEKFSI